jgi:membrane-associated phospholipid phosphatase
MLRYLAVLIWPVGMAVIFGIAYAITRGNPGTAPVRAGHENRAAQHSHRASSAGGRDTVLADAVAGSLRFLPVAAVGAVVAFAVMALLGLLVVHHGLTIDRPIFNWIQNHRSHLAKAAMDRLTKIGDTWTTWGAAGAAAVCLAVTWRDRRWLPPVALAAAIVVDHFTTLALRHVFHRLGPPTSPLGTYPSGGADRCIFLYGLIAYLIWREFSGRRTTAIWVAAAVAALGFNEAYSRVYLSLHWFTDALSGLLYGALLLAGFVLAVRVVAGPAPAARAAADGTPVRVSYAPEGPAG